MPYKKSYGPGSIPGASTKPSGILGSQGNPAKIAQTSNGKPAGGHSKFPGGFKAKNAPTKPFNHATGDE